MRFFRTRTVLMAVGTLFGVLAVVGAVLVASGRVHLWVRELAISQLSQALNGEVRIDAISGSLLRGITIHGFAISQNGSPVIEADAVRATYQLTPFLRRRAVFDNVTLVRPHVRLEQRADGWNVASLTKPSASPADADARPWTIVLSDVAIEDGRVLVTMPGRETIDLRDLSLEGNATFADHAEIAVSSASFRDATSGAVVSTLEGQVRLEGQRLAVEGLDLITNGLRVAGDLAVDDGALANAAVTITATSWTAASLAPHVPELTRAWPALSGDLSLRGQAPRFDLTWEIRVAPEGSSNGRLGVEMPEGQPVRVAGRLEAAGINPAVWSGQSTLDGLINADADVDARVNLERLDESTATVDVRVNESRVMQYVVNRLDASAELARAQVRLRGAARAYGASATFDARSDISGASKDPRGCTATQVRGCTVATGRIADLNLERLPVELPALTSDLSFDYAVRLGQDWWDADITTAESRVDVFGIGGGTRVQAEGRGTNVTVVATADRVDVPGEVLRLPNGVVSDLSGTLAGRASFDTTRMNDLSTMTATVQAGLVESDPASPSPARADVDVAVEAGVARIARLDVVSPLADVSATGDLAIADAAASPSNLEYRVHVPDLSRLQPFGVPAMEGAVQTTGHIGGTARDWEVDGTVAAQQVAYGETAEALTVNADVKLQVPLGDWTRPAATADLEGDFITAAGYEIPTAKLTMAYRERQLELQGRIEQPERAIDFDSSIDLYPDYQQVHVRRMALEGQGAPWRFAGEEEAVIRYSPAELVVDGLVLERDGERVRAGGRVAFNESAQMPSDFVVEAENVNVGDLSTLVTGTPRFTGTANGRVQMTGLVSDPTVAADLQLVDGAVVEVPFSSITIDADASGRVATVAARVVEARGAVLDISGEVPFDLQNNAMDFRVQSSAISLGLVQAATTAISDVRGTAAVDVRARGTLPALQIDGQAMVEDGAFTVVATGVTYQNVGASVRLNDGWADVERASLSDEGGRTLTLTGRTALRAENGVRAVELAVQSTGIQILDNDLGDVELRADLRVSGAVTAPRVTGRLVAARARLEVDELLRQLATDPGVLPAEAVPEPAAVSSVGGLESRPAPTPVEPAAAPENSPVAQPAKDDEAPGVFAGSSFDLEIQLPDNVVLRGRDLRTGSGSMGLGDMNMTVGGSVRVQKAPGADPTVMGAVEVVRGFYEFQGRRFEVARGSQIGFRGDEPSNPSLNVTGERNVSGVVARVQIAGTARRPILRLSSQPPLDESDVLALIVFNQPLNQLGEAEQVNLVERASDIALGALASTLTSSISGALDVDLFEIRAPTSGRAGEVAVGTQVSDRVFVGFRQQFGAGDASRVSIEYRLTEALRLLTSFGQGQDTAGSSRVRDNESAGLDLIYTIRY